MRHHSKRGFTFLEIMIVVGIVGMLVTMAMPNFLRTRALAQKNVCIENMLQLESAKQLFALEKGKSSGYTVVDAELFGDGLFMKRKPECPAGGDYDLALIGTNTTCSYALTLEHVLR
jgi:prepilin-type N-terminal cleavage/methylation domain-containing protein